MIIENGAPDPERHRASQERREGCHGAGGRLALYALYWVVAIVQPQGYRLRFLLSCLVLTFVLYPFRRGSHRDRVPAADWLLILVAAARSSGPSWTSTVHLSRDRAFAADVVLGTALIALVIEATRRTAGPVLAIVAIGFLPTRGWPVSRPRGPEHHRP